MSADELLTTRSRPDLANEFVPMLGKMGCGDDILSWAGDYVHRHAGRIMADVDYLANLPAFASCLNVGGAPFLFEYLLRRRLPHVAVSSLDLEPDRFPQLGSVIDVDILSIDVEQADQVQTITQKFDCVVLCEIFEHFRLDLMGTLASIKRLLRDDGVLYLTTPNGVSLAGVKRVLRDDTGPDPLGEWSKLGRLGHMGHVREYSVREVASLLEGSGFQVIDRRFRQPQDRSWTARMASLKPNLAAEIVILARPAV